jgi:hypothetical protein
MDKNNKKDFFGFEKAINLDVLDSLTKEQLKELNKILDKI